jgi:glycosyltransferase involved in cell wall biosynthesis
VIFTGYVSEGRLRWLYEHAAAYVFPSLSEGFGLPPLEAMIHGAPVVSSNATCLPEIYGDAAHYFDPTDVSDMAKKIDDVLSNPKLREELVEKGKIQVKKYSWKRMTEQTLDVYKKVLEEK